MINNKGLNLLFMKFEIYKKYFYWFRLYILMLRQQRPQQQQPQPSRSWQSEETYNAEG